MTEPEFIDPIELRLGPVRHESLPPDLLDQIKAIFDVIGPYLGETLGPSLGQTLEQFELGFMRDTHPGREVAIWRSITAAWLAYHEKYLNNEKLSDEQEKKLLSALVVISTGVDDVSQLNVSEEVGRRLLQCYDDLGKV